MKKLTIVAVALFAILPLIITRSASAVGENGACNSCEKIKRQYADAVANENWGSKYSLILLYDVEMCWWNNGPIDQNPPNYCNPDL